MKLYKKLNKTISVDLNSSKATNTTTSTMNSFTAGWDLIPLLIMYVIKFENLQKLVVIFEMNSKAW